MVGLTRAFPNFPLFRFPPSKLGYLIGSSYKSYHVIYQPPPQALRFSHGRGERETRVTGDEPQGTMGRVQKR